MKPIFVIHISSESKKDLLFVKSQIEKFKLGKVSEVESYDVKK